MKIKEEFARELIPGQTYYFMKYDRVLSGKYKRRTESWLIFEDENGKEILLNVWSNVATTQEDIEGVERAVDSMEKDIKLPSRVPNKDIKAPNRHGFVESGYKSGNRYYGGLPSDSDYKGPGKDAKYYKELTAYFKKTTEEHPEYKVIGASPLVLILKTPDGKEKIDLTKFDGASSAEEAIKAASKHFDESLTEANELEKRAKKHKKKSKGMSMFGLKPNAGNVEINNKVFNAMNNVTNSPSTNPTGPMGEEMTKLEAMTCLNRLNEEDSNERDFAIYCNNAFGKYKVANWKATDAETAVAEFKELNPKYTKTGLITAVEI